MSTATVDATGASEEPAKEGERPTGGRFGWRPGNRLVVAAGGTAGAWLLALAAHLVHADVITLLLVLVATVAVLRSGSALDRLIVALALGAGLCCAGALAFSYWPWHLEPVALAGAAGTVLAVTAAIRMPLLRPRPWIRPADLVIALTTGVYGLVMAWPGLGHGLSYRLGLVIRGEDLARHFAMYDTIRRVGGLAFLHRPQAASSVYTADLAYPQGAHLLTAIVDNFVTSSAAPGDPVAALDRFLIYDQLAYVFLGLAVLWAARRVAGPAVSALGFLPVAGACAGYLLFGSMFTTYVVGFFPEIVAMGFLALLIGVLVRPLADAREQVLVVAALVVALAYAYYLLLAVAAVAVLAYAVVWRRPLLRHWLLVVPTALVGGAVCLVPRLAAGNENDLALSMLLRNFGVMRMDRGPIIMLALAVLVGGVATRSWWRSPGMRVLAASGLAGIGVSVAVGWYEVREVGYTIYFFEKSLHVLTVVLLVGLGAFAPLVQRMIRKVRPAGGGRWPGRAWLAPVATAVLLALLPVADRGGLDWNPRNVGPSPIDGVSWGRLYVAGRSVIPAPAHAALATVESVPDPAHKATLVNNQRDDTFLATLWVSVLNRDYGTTRDAYTMVLGLQNATQYEQAFAAHPGMRFQVVTTNVYVLADLRQYASQHPGLDLEIIDLNRLSER